MEKTSEKIAEEISEKNFDLVYFVEQSLKKREMREIIIDLTLNDSRIMVYYHGYYILDKASQAMPDAFYPRWEDFRGLLGHKNSYHRDIGLTLIANLTAVDAENRFGPIFEEYFSLLYDKKYMTASCCIQNSGKILHYRRNDRSRIVEALLNHQRKTAYTEKQEALLMSDIIDALEVIYDEFPDRERLDGFIRDCCSSISPKTKKKAKGFLAEKRG